MTKEELYFPVRMVETSSICEIKQQIPRFEGAVIATDEETGEDKVVNFCSAGYGLLPIKEILEPIEGFLGSGFAGEYQHNNHQTFSVLYFLNKDSFTLEEGETVVPVLKVFHSYDSSITYKLLLGYFLEEAGVVVHVGFDPLSFVHTQNGLDGLLEDTFDQVGKFVVDKDTFNNVHKALKSQKIKKADVEGFVDSIFEKTKILLSQRENVLELLAKRGVTYWDVYLAFAAQLRGNPTIGAREYDKARMDKVIFDCISNL